MAKSHPIKKDVVLSGRGKKSVRRSAHVDTGSYRCVIATQDARAIGAVPVGIASTLLLLGKHIDGEIVLVHVHLPSGGCAAVVEAFTPLSKGDHVPTIVGQSFLEKVGATVSFRDGKPVVCPTDHAKRKRKR